MKKRENKMAHGNEQPNESRLEPHGQDDEKMAGDVTAAEENRPVMETAGSGDELTAKDYEQQTEAMAETGEMKPRKAAARGRSNRKGAMKRTHTGSKASRKTAQGRKAKGGMAQRSQSQRNARTKSSKRHGD